MANSLDYVFDVRNGLEWPTNTLAHPHNIIKVDNEHKYAVAVSHPAPVLVSGFEVEVGEREQDIPGIGQHASQLDPQADLARALENFQELDRVRFGVLRRKQQRIINELPEDYCSSKDEIMEEFPSAGDLPYPRMNLDLKMEGDVAQFQDQCSEATWKLVDMLVLSSVSQCKLPSWKGCSYHLASAGGCW